MSDKFDPMAEMDRLEERQKGLPSGRNVTSVTKDEVSGENTANSPEKTAENELEKKQSSFSTQDTVEQEVTKESEYTIVPDKQPKTNLQKKEVDFEGKNPNSDEFTEEETFQNQNKEHQSKLKKLKGTSSKVIVSQGDKLQATVATVIFDWRGESGLQQAEQHRDLLLKKVSELGSLNETEREALKYAQDFIKKHEARKDKFEKDIKLSKDDKEEIVELLGDYLEVADFQISPLLIIGVIIAVTLFSNLYTAFTAHPKYNPPM